MTDNVHFFLNQNPPAFIPNLHLKYLFPERRETNRRMRLFMDINAHKQGFGTFACIHMNKKLVDSVI